MADPDRIEILSERELGLTLARLASQVLESAEDSRSIDAVGDPHPWRSVVQGFGT